MDLRPTIDDKDEEDSLRMKEKSKHESESVLCEELPKKIHHPIHPNHPLYLQEDDYSFMGCVICSRCLKMSYYQCNESECYFTIHPKCASVMPSIKHEEHNHVLTLIETRQVDRRCRNCRWVLYSHYAHCFQCDISYHLQCGPQGLPATTIYDLHNHPLFLAYNNDERKVCDVCEKQIHQNIDHTMYEGIEFPMYNCQECDYSCHVRCVISEIKRDKRDKLDHASHEHVLFLCDEDNKDEASCCVCGNFVCVDQNTFPYGCSPCSFYLHKSCVDKLPVVEIEHEFHTRHPLTLYWNKDGFKCDACHIKNSGFSYRCVQCDFNVELECALKVPSIREEQHHHLLSFFNKLYANQICLSNCGFHDPDAAFLRCVECKFSVHLLCSSLPREIKFKGHLHLLALQDYHIEDDFGEYYCDHCEGPRDPKECAYHCAEGCPYVVEFNCVIDEVLRSLNDEKVEVRKVDRHAVDEYHFRMVTKGLYLHDVYKCSEKEELELKGLKTTISQMEVERMMDKEYYLQFSFSLFKSDKIERARRKWMHSPVFTVDLKSEVVKIGNYIITKNLETVFTKIHSKYSDIGDKCSLSEGSKTIVLIEFVQVIHEMIQTKIVKITDEVFLSWLFRMMFVQQAGFSVDFVFEHTNKLGAIRFGIEKDLDIFPELKRYYKEIEVLTDNIEARNAILVKLKMDEKRITDFLYHGSSKEERLRLLNNMDFTLEIAGKGLL